MPPKSERAQNVIQYVRGEIELFSEGKLERMSTLTELAERFEYSVGGIHRILSPISLIQTRHELEHQHYTEHLVPSPEYAWTLGVLAAGGNVRSRPASISLPASHDEIIDAFKLVGEHLFRTNAVELVQRKKSASGKQIERREIRFYNIAVTRAIGDFRMDNWPQTLQEVHSWILENEGFIWNFLQGFFELKGNIYSRGNRNKYGIERSNKLVFSTSSIHAAHFIAELLERVGINKPRIIENQSRKNGVAGVSVQNLEDLSHFASNITSLVPQKEELLNNYRQIDPSVIVSLRNRSPLPRELIEEYQRLVTMLGHAPSGREIDELSKKGITKWSREPYKTRFGEGNFSVAHRFLAKLTNSTILVHVRPEPELLLAEWRRLGELLGHSPTRNDIVNLRKSRKTKWSDGPYKRVFGNGSWHRAREYLEQVVSEQKNADGDVNQEIQIFP